MATIGIQSIETCGGGGHKTIRVTVNGIERSVFVAHIDDVTGQVSNDEITIAALLLIRAHAIGKTKSAVAANLDIGLTVVV